MKEIKDMLKLLSEAPETQIDEALREKIVLLKDPRSIDILNLLDETIYSSIASDFVVSVLQILLNKLIVGEGTTYEILSKSSERQYNKIN